MIRTKWLTIFTLDQVKYTHTNLI